MSRAPNVKVFAIISDYDGTLCPAGDIRIKSRNMIPAELKNVLWEISRNIPVCILSSKDYRFLCDKVPFANIISCVMGIETLVLGRNEPSKIMSRHLLAEEELIRSNADALNQLADDVGAKFPDVAIERKLTYDELLAGITFDWRSHKDWKRYSNLVTRYVQDAVSNGPRSGIYVQTYSSHPFVDVYAVKCDKGLGFDRIASDLGYSKAMGAILYLGDSENDNPAFRKAEVSIGIRSDDRLKPRLDCQHSIDYRRLAIFLQRLKNNDFEFEDGLLSTE